MDAKDKSLKKAVPRPDPNGKSAVLDDTSYWKFMADYLAANRGTPANYHYTRLIYLTISLSLYPVVYTYVALYPESYLARHVHPTTPTPDPLSWEQTPETWWKLVKEISWLAFS